jgi:hypothetical protein
MEPDRFLDTFRYTSGAPTYPSSVDLAAASARSISPRGSASFSWQDWIMLAGLDHVGDRLVEFRWQAGFSAG